MEKITTTGRLSIGDKVSHKPDLYGMTESVVIEIIRKFQEGPRELVYLESSLDTMRSDLNPRIETIDGKDYFIHDALEAEEGRPWSGIEAVKAPFSGYCVVTENKKISTMWSEKSLKKIK